MLFALHIICNCMRSEDESTLHQRSRSLSFRCSNFPQDRQTLSGHCFGVILTIFWSRCADYTLSLSVVPPGIHSTIIHYALLLHHCAKYLKALWCGPHSECVVKITVESLCVCVWRVILKISRGLSGFPWGQQTQQPLTRQRVDLIEGHMGGLMVETLQICFFGSINLICWVGSDD